MRTTITIADDLFRQAKSRAALEGIPLRELVEKGLTLALAAPSLRAAPHRVAFPILRSRQPGSLSAVDVHRAEQQAQLDEDRRPSGCVCQYRGYDAGHA